MIMRKLILSMAVATMTISAWSCTQSKEAKTEKDIEKVMQDNKAVGLAVAVVKDTNIVYSKAFGLKDIEKNEPLELDDIFRIASISKSFTATGIMQMVEQGKIKLEEDVSELVGYPIRNPKYPDTPITVRMLLSHTSSINDSEGYYQPGVINILNPAVNETYANAYNDYEPGTSYGYCNLNFNMMGTILEKVSGERFDKYIVNHILKPIGVEGGYEVATLDFTKFVTLYEYDAVNDKFIPSPEAYAPRRDQIANYEFGFSTPVFSPTGGMKLTPIGLAKVMMMHMHKGLAYNNGQPVRVIEESSAEIMQSRIAYPTDEGDAYGFAIRTTEQLIDGVLMKGHTGGAYGVLTAMFWQPDENWGLIIMTNGCNEKRDHNFMTIHRDAARVLYNNWIAKDK